MSGYLSSIKNWWGGPSLSERAGKEFTDGVTKSLLQTVTNITGFNLVPSSNSASAIQPPNLQLATTVMDGLQSFVLRGAAKVEIEALKTFLQNCNAHDPSGQDKKIKNVITTAREELQAAKTPEEFEKVWKKVSEYHVSVLGQEINPKPYANAQLKEQRTKLEKTEQNLPVSEGKQEINLNSSTPVSSKEESKASDSVNPYDKTVKFPTSQIDNARKKIDRLKDNLKADPRVSPSAGVEAPQLPVNVSSTQSPPQNDKSDKNERETDLSKHRFVACTTDYCTMLAIDYLFGYERKDDEIKKIVRTNLQENGSTKGNVRSEYFSSFSRAEKFLLFIPYIIIHALLESLLNKILTKIIDDLRDFLKNEQNVLDFLEKKLDVMIEYLGRFDKAKDAFLAQNKIGSLKEYLLIFIPRYMYGLNDNGIDNGISANELITLFKNYLVDNYVPRLDFSIRGVRIPFLTGFCEWLVLQISKGSVRTFLGKKKILEGMVDSSTQLYAKSKLDLTTYIVDKLTEICDALEKAQEKKRTEAKEKSTPKPLETKVVHKFHSTLRLFSENLLRFLAIEDCQGSNKELREIDSGINRLLLEVLKSPREIFQQIPKLMLHDTLLNATTNICEISFNNLNVNANDIEKQLPKIFKLLELFFEKKQDTQSFNKINDDQKPKSSTLRDLIGQLSKVAVTDAVMDNLYTTSAGKIDRVYAFVEHEKKRMKDFAASLEKEVKDIMASNLEPEQKYLAIKKRMESALSTISHYLNSLPSLPESAAFRDCFTDVKGDMSNALAILVQYVSGPIADSLDNICKKNQEVYDMHTHIQTMDKIYESLGTLFLKEGEGEDQVLKTIHSIDEQLKNLPEQMRTTLTEFSESQDLSHSQYGSSSRIDELRTACRNYNQTDSDIKKKERYDQETGKLESINNEEAALLDLQHHLKLLAEAIPKIKHKREALLANEQIISVKQKINDLNNEHPFYANSKITDLKDVFNSCAAGLIDESTLDAIHRILTGTGFVLFRKPGLLQDLSSALASQSVKKAEAIKLSKTYEISSSKKDLESKRLSFQQNFNSSIGSFKQALVTAKRMATKSIQDHELDINKSAENIKLQTQAIKNVGDQLFATGGISFNEWKFQDYENTIVGSISPLISSRIETLVDTFGKPAYFEELLRRLLILGFAEKQRQGI